MVLVVLVLHGLINSKLREESQVLGQWLVPRRQDIRWTALCLGQLVIVDVERASSARKLLELHDVACQRAGLVREDVLDLT